ncbi:hypothetical protein LPJ66_010955 [Kickxella alabastrina]|uniref:Uncharacterized protein n=1 Tax=Kickxella alabastrina TaxID=61397 RepID=A0ACC1I0J8_9FUNG|nr:hypothetical protein LPJ66_010955 [Kickxella alabastrina]
MDSGQQQQQQQPVNTGAKDKGPDNSSSSSSTALGATSSQTTRQNKGAGMLGRVAGSANRLATGIVRSGAHGPSVFDPSILAESKSGRQGETSSMSQEWMAESSQGRPATHTHTSSDQLPVVSGPSSTASAFRQAARKSQTESHQVQLVQNLDGQDVIEFLSRTLPTSMNATEADRGAAAVWKLTRQQGPYTAGTLETTDALAYLQGSTYAADMEIQDHQVPLSVPGSVKAVGNTTLLRSSPSGLAKSWNEHGALILEEWRLNEAWDRAWMGTAWQTSQKKETAPDKPQTPKAEPVKPSKRNLSYLLKPRI